MNVNELLTQYQPAPYSLLRWVISTQHDTSSWFRFRSNILWLLSAVLMLCVQTYSKHLRYNIYCTLEQQVSIGNKTKCSIMTPYVSALKHVLFRQKHHILCSSNLSDLICYWFLRCFDIGVELSWSLHSTAPFRGTAKTNAKQTKIHLMCLMIWYPCYWNASR